MNDDFIHVTGTAVIAGTLTLKGTPAFSSTGNCNDTFTILTASSLPGALVNAPGVLQLVTDDGLGTFALNFSSTSITLTNFVATPEPST